MRLEKEKRKKSLYLDLDLLFFKRLLDLDLRLCFRLDERDRLRLFDGSDSFFCCGDFEGLLFFDFTMLAMELRYSDALHGGKAGSLVCSLLVEMDRSTTDSTGPEVASVCHKKNNFNTIYI